MRRQLLPKIHTVIRAIGPVYGDRSPLLGEIQSKKEELRTLTETPLFEQFLDRAIANKDEAALAELTFYGSEKAYAGQQAIFEERKLAVDRLIEEFAQENELDTEFVRKSVTLRSGPSSDLYLA